jgi:hypothetical protein
MHVRLLQGILSILEHVLVKDGAVNTAIAAHLYSFHQTQSSSLSSSILMLVWRPLIWLSYYPDARIRASSLRLLYVPASFVFHNKQNQHHNASREYSPMKEPDHVFVSLLFHVAIERLYDVSNVVVQTALALVPRSFVLGNLDRNRVGLSFAAICMERVRTNKRGSKQV